LIFTITCSMLIPCIWWIILARKFKGVGRSASVGLLGYCIPQLLFITPISVFLSTSDVFSSISENSYFYAVFGAVIASVFETFGRFVVLKNVMKRDGRVVSVFATGLGHGTCESFISGGITYMVNLSVCFMINMNTLPKNENYENIKNDLMNLPVSDCFAAGIERISVLLLQAALYIILADFLLKNKKGIGLILCMFVQFVFISGISIISITFSSVWVTECAAAISSIAVALFAWNKRSTFPKEPEKQNL